MSCPAATSSGTILGSEAPVAPATKIRMAGHAAGNDSELQSRRPDLDPGDLTGWAGRSPCAGARPRRRAAVLRPVRRSFERWAEGRAPGIRRIFIYARG